MEKSWKDYLEEELSKPYMVKIKRYIDQERKNGVVIYPPHQLILSAFLLSPFDKTKCVIIGQDPYHDGSANGLAFDINFGRKKIPPSLSNIKKEVISDFNLDPNTVTIELKNWAAQGVLLLNTSLTVQSGMPGSHSDLGWKQFTRFAIKKLSEEKDHPVVFMLWGKHAQDTFIPVISENHLILTAAHPSPFSANRGFFGCKHFSKCNEFLKTINQKEISWYEKYN